jgi:hypothetical protein
MTKERSRRRIFLEIEERYNSMPELSATVEIA